jgi:hypothetical protein
MTKAPPLEEVAQVHSQMRQVKGVPPGLAPQVAMRSLSGAPTYGSTNHDDTPTVPPHRPAR